MQRNILFDFRKIIDSNPQNLDECYYNYKSGLWEDGNHQPIIAKWLKSKNKGLNNNATHISETGESIDRSENSQCDFSSLGGTLMTKTNESSDRSEISQNEISQLGRTMVTFTRESIDQSGESSR